MNTFELSAFCHICRYDYSRIVFVIILVPYWSYSIISTGDVLNENPPMGDLPRRTIPRKILISGALLLLGVVVLVITSIRGNAQYYLTVEELAAGKAGQQTNIRVSGVVLGDTIKYDPQTFHLTFTIAHIPGGNREIEAQGGLAAVLHNASLDTQSARLHVVYDGVKPDLLTNEAQAILTGSLGVDGVFYADELLLKCPSRYDEEVPQQVAP